MGFFNVIGNFIPSDYREQCLGDLYEGYFRLRARGRSKLFSQMVTAWHLLSLVCVGLQMRWEDFQASRQQVSCSQNRSRNYCTTWIYKARILLIVYVNLSSWINKREYPTSRKVSEESIMYAFIALLSCAVVGFLIHPQMLTSWVHSLSGDSYDKKLFNQKPY
jgi:hypothetical protein